jgi:ferredoxin
LVVAMPKMHPVTLVWHDGHEVTLMIAEDTFILDAAVEAEIDLPYMCLQGWCLTCAGRVVDGVATCVDNRAALRYFPEDLVGGFVLLCTGKPCRACRIATHQSWTMKSYRRKHGLPTPRG